MRRYVITHEIDDEKVMNERSLQEWAELLDDNAGQQFDEMSTWETIFQAIIWEFIFSGEHSDFVKQTSEGFATEVTLS